MIDHNEDTDTEFNEAEKLAEQESDSKQSCSEFAKMLEESFKSSGKKLKPGDKVKAEVLTVGSEVLFVSTGGMHDGQVARKDLLDKDGTLKCKVGDVLDLYVTQVRGSEIHLSPNPTAKNLADDLEDAFDMMLPVEGRVSEVCKGGVRVAMFGKTAFCPISQLDLRFVEKPEDYIGQKLEFRITQLTEGGRNIVVSRRKLLEEQRDLSLTTFAEEHKAGDVLQGTITKIEKFGAFVSVAPGVEGLVHVSEIGWSRVENPAEVVSVGQPVTVKLLKMEEVDGKLKLSLSIKQVEAQPWDNLPVNLREGSVVDGKVTRCMKFGAFVEVAPGIEGLIPLSEMSYTKRVLRSDELVQPGQRIAVMIKEIRAGERRISLSLKDAGSDPWSMVPVKFPVGTIVKGKVERREGYGLFIKIDDGITGLLPKSKALESADFPFDKLKIHDEVTVQVAELRLEERRISLQPPGDAGSEEWKSYSAQQSSSVGGSLGTLGGAFGDKLRAALEKKSGKK